MTTTENTENMTKATSAEKAPLRSPLGVLTTATATHGTGRDGDIPLPRLPGFVESAFSPLAYEVAARCLTERADGGTSRSSEAERGGGTRTAVALASLMGDTTTADLASRRVVSGRVHNPLLFMQATANSVLGHISREFGITGQMFSLSTLDDPVTELLAMADLLLEDPELDQVLMMGVELGGGERLAAVYRELSAGSDRPVPDLPESAGSAVAVLLGRPGAGAPVTIRSTESYDGAHPAPAAHPGSVQGLFDLAAAHRRLLRDGGTHVLVTDPRAPAFLLTADSPTPPHALPQAPPHASLPEGNETETHAHQ
ncbi:hypothetical protein JIX56_35490 [Streptomyces sp. CA-210063]|uniref:hypothetical protein n=1 Tax=Streptomyces sp. CA-210063 TaxID=2801029 RepID=UPI00214AC405|nr:hypothetical protein [Streptomyces sp. CA-210063]UUU34732.1 hypothetical protein JIX56_35490 [Streptomyces sp. CA-210063]